MHSSLAPYSTASWTRLRELVAVVLVGVRRALALAEAAERAADRADVRDVDVAVDDERDRLAGELRRAARRPPRASPRSPRRASPRTSPSAPLRSAQRRRGPSRSHRRRGRRGSGRAARCGGRASRPAARDEAPVLDLDRVHHRPGAIHSWIDVLRVDAQALGQRDAIALQLLAHLVRRGERVLRGDVIAVRAEAAEIGRAGRDELATTSLRGSAGPGCRHPASAAASRRSAASCPRC